MLQPRKTKYRKSQKHRRYPSERITFANSLASNSSHGSTLLSPEVQETTENKNVICPRFHTDNNFRASPFQAQTRSYVRRKEGLITIRNYGLKGLADTASANASGKHNGSVPAMGRQKPLLRFACPSISSSLDQRKQQGRKFNDEPYPMRGEPNRGGLLRASHPKSSNGSLPLLRKRLYTLQALEYGVISAAQIETMRRTIKRTLRGAKQSSAGRLNIRIFPHNPISEKPKEVRMGKGKGNVAFWAAKVQKGNSIIELSFPRFAESEGSGYSQFDQMNSGASTFTPIKALRSSKNKLRLRTQIK